MSANGLREIIHRIRHQGEAGVIKIMVVCEEHTAMELRVDDCLRLADVVEEFITILDEAVARQPADYIPLAHLRIQRDNGQVGIHWQPGIGARK